MRLFERTSIGLLTQSLGYFSWFGCADEEQNEFLYVKLPCDIQCEQTDENNVIYITDIE